MSKTWYYQIFSEEFGPVGESEIRELLDCETLCRSDLVRAADSTRWVSISSIDAFVSDSMEFADLAELELCFREAPPESSDATTAPPNKTSDQRVKSAASSSIIAASAPETFYYQSSGRTFGPVVVVELAGMAEAGVISASDLVRRGDAGAWTEASGLKELAHVLISSRQRLVEQVKAPELEKKSRPSSAGKASVRRDSESPSDTARVPKQKSKPVEDTFLKEILEEISANQAKANSSSTSVVSPSAHLSVQENSIAVPQSAARVQPAVFPMPVQAPSVPAYKSTQSSMATPVGSAPRPVRVQSRPSRGSSFSFDGPLKQIVVALVVLVAVGGIWQAAAPLFGGSIVGSYSSQVTAVMEQYKAIGPSPSADEWAKFSNGVRMEFVQYYKDALTKGASDPASVACIESMKQVMALASTRFDETAKRKEIEATIEKNVAETKK